MKDNDARLFKALAGAALTALLLLLGLQFVILVELQGLRESLSKPTPAPIIEPDSVLEPFDPDNHSPTMGN